MPRTTGLRAGDRKEELAEATRAWSGSSTGYGTIPANGQPGTGLRGFAYAPFGKALDPSITELSRVANRNANTPLGQEIQSIASEASFLRRNPTEFDTGKNLFDRVDDLIDKGFTEGTGRKPLGGIALDELKKLRTRIQNGLDERAAANGAEHSFSTVQGEYARRKGLEDALDVGSEMFNRSTVGAAGRSAPAAADDLAIAFNKLAPEAQAEARFSYASRKLDEMRQEAGDNPAGLVKRLTSFVNSNEGRDLSFAFDNPANFKKFMLETAQGNVVQDGVQAFRTGSVDEIATTMRNLRMAGREFGGDAGAQVLERQFKKGIVGDLAEGLRGSDTGVEAGNRLMAGGETMRRKLDIAFGPKEARRLTARAAAEAKLTRTSRGIASAVAVPRGIRESQAGALVGSGGTAVRPSNVAAGIARRLGRSSIGDRVQRRIAELTMQQGAAGKQAFDAAMRAQMIRTESPAATNGILARLFGQQAGGVAGRAVSTPPDDFEQPEQ